MSGSSHIRSVIIGVEYQNCRQTLNAYLLFAILLWQIKSKLNWGLLEHRSSIAILLHCDHSLEKQLKN
jgi:hypothetical protein